MQMSDLIELEQTQSAITVTCDPPEQNNASQSHDAEQLQTKFEVKSVCPDTLERTQFEALKSCLLYTSPSPRDRG
eukprot:2737159-Rhodomonas_salina.1